MNFEDKVDFIKNRYSNPNTQKVYINGLKKIESRLGDIMGIEVQDLKVWFHEDDINGQTANTLLNTAKVFLHDEDTRADIEILRADIVKKINLRKAKVNAEKDKKLPSLSKVRAESYKQTNPRNIIITYLLMNYYTRNLDLYIKIVTSMKDTTDKNLNYLVINKAGKDSYKIKYIRNIYKTSKIYGQKVYEMRNKRLNEAVAEYLHTEGAYLLGGTKPIEINTISPYIPYYTPFNLTESDLFKIYIKSIDKSGNISALQRASERRGTSINTILSNYHINNPELKKLIKTD